MLIMKFGGTSLGCSERIRSAGERVRERLPRQPVVVVSAMGGITDLLIQGAQRALQLDPEVWKLVDQIADRHQETVSTLLAPGPRRERLLAYVEKVMVELRALYLGVRNLSELTPRTLDAIAGVGERLSFEIMAANLDALGVPARALDARKVLVTDDHFGSATPLLTETAARVQELVRPLVHGGVVPVLPGYIGATRDGIATTLGRGGSDWSASLIGATLPAKAIEIWTDVDGLMTADPRVVREAKVIPEVSFAEAAELAYFGARVLHPATIKPAVERCIPVWIRNSLNPAAPGTCISAQTTDASDRPAAISFKRGVSVVSISQPRLAHGFVARVFDVFARHRTTVDLIASSDESVSVTVDHAARVPAIEADLAQLGKVRVQRCMSLVSLVGRGFLQRAGMAAWIFQAVRDVNIAMIAFGASEMNVSFVVGQEQAEATVQALHREFFGGISIQEVPAKLGAAAGRIAPLENAS